MTEIKAEQVPDEVETAMKDAMLREGSTFKDIAAAALTAWPGMLTRPSVPDGVWHSYDCSHARIILPLPPQEAT